MNAQLVSAATRLLPLPGRALRPVLSSIDHLLTYPETPFVTSAHFDFGRFEIVDFHEYIQRNIYFLGYYEIRETRLVRRLLGPGDVFVDIGANIGWFTAVASRRVGGSGHVFAFEPSARIARRLERTVQLNGLANVTIEELALSDTSGTALLFGASATNMGTASLVSESPCADRAPDEEVRTETFDAYAQRHALSNVKLVKIDVEGAEAKVLKGMEHFLRERCAEHILIEVSAQRLRSVGETPAGVLSSLRHCGYRLYRVGLWRLSALRDDAIGFANVLAMRSG